MDDKHLHMHQLFLTCMYAYRYIVVACVIVWLDCDLSCNFVPFPFLTVVLPVSSQYHSPSQGQAKTMSLSKSAGESLERSLRAISVHYLSTTLKAEVLAAGFSKDALPDVAVYSFSKRKLGPPRFSFCVRL